MHVAPSLCGWQGERVEESVRILLGYNWYINEPFLGWQSGGKKQGAQDYPGYLVIVVKRGKKSALKENEKMIGILFNVLVTKHAFNGYMCSF